MVAKHLRLFSILLFVIICVLIIPSPDVSAAQKSYPKTIKVGVLNNTSYAYKDKNGVWRGTDIECMIDIAQRAGFKVKFIDSNTDPDFMGSLDKGKYDIVADVVKTSDRKNKYLFTDEALGIINSSLAVRADDNRWNYGNVDQISRMKIGVLSSYANNGDFRKWCTRHGVNPKIIEYADIEKMTAALKKGRIDGEVYSAGIGEEYTQQFHTIMKLLPESYYFAFRKGDVELKNDVDEAIAQILAGNVNYFTNLQDRYATQFKSNVLPFSAAEKNFISRNPTIHVGVLKNDAPFYNKESRQGIIPDYYKLIQKYSGLKFDYKVFDTQKEMSKAVRDGKIDVIGIFKGGTIDGFQDGLMLTDSIYNMSTIMLTKQDTNVSDVRIIAVPESIAETMSESVDEVFPKAKLVVEKDIKHCFDSMENGKTDAALCGLPGATWLMNQKNSTSYNVIPVPVVMTDLCAAVKSGNGVLCSILNKSIEATKDNFSGIVTKDTLPQNDWKAVISRIPPLIIVLVTLALVMLIIGLGWTLFILKRRQNEHAEAVAAKSEAKLQRMKAEENKKSADEKNAFFSNISHDMRTPLNAIIGFAHMARSGNKTDIQKDEYLEKIESSGNLLLELINDTLIISKMNSDKLELDLRPAVLDKVIEEVILPVREVAAYKNIAITFACSERSHQEVLMDKLNVKKVLLNLLNNAVKYTPENGHIRIIVRDAANVDLTDCTDAAAGAGTAACGDQREVDGGRYEDAAAAGAQNEAADAVTEIMVKDDGIGISEEFLPHIFEPFSQERRHGYESVGTGLGLSIVKRLVNLMGGTIDVQSEKDRGTTFIVRIHFKRTDEIEEAVPEVQGDQDFDFEGMKMLVCEDNELNREIAVAMLEEKGITADTAYDGRSGVERFAASREGEYDAILMDIRMPYMDGYEATAAIRALDRRDAAVPIIAMTADAFSDDIKKSLENSMDAHIAKPLDADTMFRTIAAALIKVGR